MRSVAAILLALSLGLPVLPASAQNASVAFGDLEHDSSEAVEVTADNLSIDQDSGMAVFSGNVLIVQGDLKLSAGEIRIDYSEDDASGSGIGELIATGGVILTVGEQAVEAQEAEYLFDDEVIVLRGKVLIVDGRTAISGDRMRIDIAAGTGTIEGRVRTVFNPDGG